MILIAGTSEGIEFALARLNAIPEISCVAPHAAFSAMPKVALPSGKTGEGFVLALLRQTGILCAYGLGFGLPAPMVFPAWSFSRCPTCLVPSTMTS